MVRKEKKKQRNVLTLIVLLVIVLVGSVIFVGAVSGWFEEAKVTLSEEYYDEFVDYDKISGEEYEELISKKDSFVVFVDQVGCDTAERLREYVKDWATEMGVKVKKIMFSEMRDTSMHDLVKYYPSVVVVEKGRIKAFLKADKDEDAEKYNNYEAFKGWIEKHIQMIE